MEAKRRTPVRQCVACRTQRPKGELMRVVATDGGMEADPTGKRQGRGAYICRSEQCLARAQKTRALERALQRTATQEFWDSAKELIEKEINGQGPEDIK